MFHSRRLLRWRRFTLEEHRQELLDQALSAVRTHPKLRQMAEVEERKRERQERKMRIPVGTASR